MKRRITYAVSITILLVAIVSLLAVNNLSAPPKTEHSNNVSQKQDKSTVDKTLAPQPIKGQTVSVGDQFDVSVPNGWRASVSSASSFIAIQYARPGQLESLVYDAEGSADVDYGGIPAWNGLTEHFYIRAMTSSSQEFKPATHAEVTSQSFTFDDGTVGTKYSVTKHAAEAQKWGGLLKDSEWYGRVFVYKHGGKTVEAHLAFYPSTKIDESFYEKVAKSISAH